LLVVFLVALASRLGWVLTRPEALAFPDEESYMEIAENFLAGKGFVTDGGSVATRTPIYPFFLAGAKRFFGPSLLRIRILQALLGSAVPVILYFVGRTHFGKGESLFAATLAAIYPPFILYTGLLLSETIFLVMLLLGILFMARMARRVSYGVAAGAGSFLGLAALVRPGALFFLPFALPFFIYFTREKMIALKATVAMVACFVIVLFPWALRNFRHTGHLVWTTLEGGRSLYEAVGPYATGGPAMHLTKWPEETLRLNEYDADKFLREEALEYAKEHPWRTARLALIKFCRTYAPIPNVSTYRTPLYIVASLISYVPVLLFGLCGMWRERAFISSCWPFFLPVIYFTVLHMVFVGSIRYRDQFIWSFMLFAGALLFSRGTPGTDK